MTTQIPMILRSKPEKVVQFMMEVQKLCKKYGISISFQNSPSTVVLTNYQHKLRDWFYQAVSQFQHPIQEPIPKYKLLGELDLCGVVIQLLLLPNTGGYAVTKQSMFGTQTRDFFDDIQGAKECFKVESIAWLRTVSNAQLNLYQEQYAPGISEDDD